MHRHSHGTSGRASYGSPEPLSYGSCLQTRAATSFVKLSSIAAWTPWWMETM